MNIYIYIYLKGMSIILKHNKENHERVLLTQQKLSLGKGLTITYIYIFEVSAFVSYRIIEMMR